jgi:predicted enzyme related to lactoylglutathione lyase
MITHFILYVADQDRSTQFYSAVLDMAPTLHVPGMTEFKLGESCVLGLMPEAGIKRLLGDTMPDPAMAGGIPRAEIYLVTDGCDRYYERALKNGARSLSEPAARDWGDRAAYCLDHDGHVIAFAEKC